MMSEPKIAKTAVADLSKQDMAVFSVDGEAFPWWISEAGPSARKLADDLYLVHVEIFATITEGDDRVEGFHHGGLPDWGWPQPIMCGTEFPWCISQDGFTYRSSGSTLPTVELEFFAESVEGMPVTDHEAPDDGKLRMADGRMLRRTCPNCAALVAYDWIELQDGIYENTCPKCGFVHARSHPEGPLEVIER